MNRRAFSFSQLGKALKNDGRILLRDTEGRAAPSPKAMAIGAGILLAGLLAISIATSSQDTEASVPQTLVTAEQRVLSADALTDFRTLSEHQANAAKTLNLTLKPGQSLGPLMQAHGVEPNTAYAATQAFADVQDPRYLRAGQDINLYFDGSNGDFTGLSLKPNMTSTVFVNKGPDGDFHSRMIEAEFDKELVTVSGEIENSLYLDAGALGAPDKVIVQFAQIYAHSVDFQRDIRNGDAFELMFELYRDHQGNPVKAGDLLYTSFSPRGKTSAYYLFTSPSGHEGFYDADGKGAKRMLMRTPVSGARLSSSFGNRRHPVLGYAKLHKGVDFAAPTGTPIMAAGTGTVERAGPWSTYGNYIRIKHSDGYATAYAHLSKFARGIRSGTRVIQGQTIGYVGATGRVTGAHLHYEVLKNGKHINPMSLSTLSGKPIEKKDLPAFKARAAEIDTLRAAARPAITPEVLTADSSDGSDMPPLPGQYVLLPQN